jgi:GT2 family glycosyltransferase
MKLLSVALLWHFPILAPTICIRGKREENKQPPRLNSQYGWQSATHAHSLRTAATESECLNLIARKEAGDDPKVSIVISTHNRKEKLRRLIESITKSDYSVDKREIFIVDDASTDGTFEMVTSLCPQARLLRTKNEVFPAKSRDIAAKSVTGEYLFFIDDDCLVTPTAITRLVEVALSMKNKAGIVAPLLTCLENPSAVWCAGASLRLNGLFDTAHMCQGLNPNRLQEEYRLLEIGYSPSAFLLKRSVYLEVGGFDYKDFPMGWEDIDLGLKVAKNGYKNICVTQAVVIHDKELRGRARNSMRAYHHGKSRTVFYRKYMGSKVPLMPIYLIGFSLWNADINLAFRYLNGVIQGLKEKLDTGNGCWKAGSPTLDSALAQEKILNLGCGDQVFGEVRLDRYRGAANVIADAETSLPFKDDSFDVVYSRFVFEHLRNPSFVLKEMVRVLEPEGKLVLITDNAAFPPFHLPASFGSGFHAGGYEGSGVEDRHYCLYTLEHLAHHFQYAGLKIETLKFVRADEVGGNDGIWQQITNLLRINKLRVLKPFCMSNILAVGRKPPKARAHA